MSRKNWSFTEALDHISVHLPPAHLLKHATIKGLVTSLPGQEMSERKIKTLCQKILAAKKPKDEQTEAQQQARSSPSASHAEDSMHQSPAARQTRHHQKAHSSSAYSGSREHKKKQSHKNHRQRDHRRSKQPSQDSHNNRQKRQERNESPPDENAQQHIEPSPLYSSRSLQPPLPTTTSSGLEG